VLFLLKKWLERSYIYYAMTEIRRELEPGALPEDATTLPLMIVGNNSGPAALAANEAYVGPAPDVEDTLPPQVELAISADEGKLSSGGIAKATRWIKNNKLNVAWMAASAGALGDQFATGLPQVWDNVKEHIAWAIPAGAAAELTWDAGAAAALTIAGIHGASKFRNFLHGRKGMAELTKEVSSKENTASRRTRLSENPIYRTGIAVNTAGAIGMAGVAVAVATKMPASEASSLYTWAAVDTIQTVATRMPLYRGIRESLRKRSDNSEQGATSDGEPTLTEADSPVDVSMISVAGPNPAPYVARHAKEKSKDRRFGPQRREADSSTERYKTKVRKVTMEDLDAIVDLDIRDFADTYRVNGQKIPIEELKEQIGPEVREMMAERIQNVQANKGAAWMYAYELNGKFEGFTTMFRTDKPLTEFTSWENSTNGGTLDDRIVPDGQYVYVANMTMSPKATDYKVKGMNGMDCTLARMYGACMAEGLDYGYFESRMTLFRPWLIRTLREEGQGRHIADVDPEELDQFAATYAHTTKPQEVNGRMTEVPIDRLLMLFAGFTEMQPKPVRNAFKDPKSLNYGMVFKAPFDKVPKPLRPLVNPTFRYLANKPERVKVLNTIRAKLG
jgi:hypothetical protein